MLQVAGSRWWFGRSRPFLWYTPHAPGGTKGGVVELWECVNIQSEQKVQRGSGGVAGGVRESACHSGGVFISQAVPGAEI